MTRSVASLGARCEKGHRGMSSVVLSNVEVFEESDGVEGVCLLCSTGASGPGGWCSPGSIPC